jgi:hypothetical protein
MVFNQPIFLMATRVKPPLNPLLKSLEVKLMAAVVTVTPSIPAR